MSVPTIPAPVGIRRSYRYARDRDRLMNSIQPHFRQERLQSPRGLVAVTKSFYLRPILRSRQCRSLPASSPLVETGRRPLSVALDSVDRPAVSTESLPKLDIPWVCALVATENRIRAGADAAMGYPHFEMLDLVKLLVGVFRSHAAR